MMMKNSSNSPQRNDIERSLVEDVCSCCRIFSESSCDFCYWGVELKISKKYKFEIVLPVIQLCRTLEE